MSRRSRTGALPRRTRPAAQDWLAGFGLALLFAMATILLVATP